MVQSPEFEVPMLGGKLQFEFFPNGDLQAREGWSTFRLHVPDLTHLRWQVHLGGRTYGPRTDTFDKSKWWNRYGLLWLNFCPSAEARSEALPETDSLTCGVEVLEVLAMPDGEEVEPEIDADAKAATDQAAGLASALAARQSADRASRVLAAPRMLRAVSMVSLPLSLSLHPCPLLAQPIRIALPSAAPPPPGPPATRDAASISVSY